MMLTTSSDAGASAAQAIAAYSASKSFPSTKTQLRWCDREKIELERPT